MRQILLRSLALLLAAVAAVWAVDWLVWTVRGAQYRTVTVSRVVVAPLKGHREEYYPDGTVEVPCSRSALPEALPGPSAMPCWYVERHPVVWDR